MITRRQFFQTTSAGLAAITLPSLLPAQSSYENAKKNRGILRFFVKQNKKVREEIWGIPRIAEGPGAIQWMERRVSPSCCTCHLKIGFDIQVEEVLRLILEWVHESPDLKLILESTLRFGGSNGYRTFEIWSGYLKFIELYDPSYVGELSVSDFTNEYFARLMDCMITLAKRFLSLPDKELDKFHILSAYTQTEIVVGMPCWEPV